MCTSRDTSRVGACAEAGDHRRPQPERRARHGPRAVDGAAHPLPGAQRSGPRAASRVRLAPGDPDSVEIRFMDEDGADIDEGTQRKIERLLYREDFRRAFAGDIGDIVFPPRAIEFYTAALESERRQPSALRSRSFKVVLDYSFGATSIVMPNVLGKIGASVLAVNPYAATERRDGVDDLDTRVKVDRRPRAHLGLRPRATCSTPTARPRRSSTTRASRSSADQALLVLVELVCSTSGRARRHRAAGVGEPRGRAHRASATARTITWTKLSAAHLMEVAGSGDGSTSRRRRRAGSSGPRSCPRTTRSPRSCTCSTCSRRAGARCRRSSPSVPETHVAHESVPTPWERKGAVMRGVMERAKDYPDRARRRREDRVPRRLGARAARSRARGHAHVGRRQRATSRRAGWSRSTPVRSPSSTPVAVTRRTRAPMNIPEDLRYSRRARVGAGRRQRRAHRHHRLRAGQPRRRRVRAAPRRRPRRRRGRERQRDRVDQVGVRRLRAGDRASCGRERGARRRSPSSSTRTRTARAGCSRSSCSDPAELDGLLDAAAYRALIGEADPVDEPSTFTLRLRSSRRCRLLERAGSLTACSAPAADIRTPRTPGSARRAARRSSAGRRGDDPHAVGGRGRRRRGRARALPRRAAARRRPARRAARPERRVVVPARAPSTPAIGRHPDSEIFLDDITVSRRHVVVDRDDDGYTLRDVGSLNGTYVNRERVDEARAAPRRRGADRAVPPELRPRRRTRRRDG